MTQEALKLALEALEEIALAGMSGTGQESERAMTEWHARQAWKFIGIAARQRTAIKEALAQPEQEPFFTEANGFPQEFVSKDRQKQAIISMTEQCAALVWERDELQKQVWLYEKNGVTCQTYRHKVEQSCSECNVQMNYTTPPQRTEQPPVKYEFQVPDGTWHPFLDKKHYENTVEDGSWPIRALYTAPPQRTWVGLTDEERDEICLGDESIARSIEAKLREKNGGNHES